MSGNDADSDDARLAGSPCELVDGNVRWELHEKAEHLGNGTAAGGSWSGGREDDMRNSASGEF